MNIKDALLEGKMLLDRNGVEGSKASAEYLLRVVLGMSKTELARSGEQALSRDRYSKYRRWINRRAKHEPVWYITGQIEFYGQELTVTKNVLVPRPETELMIEKIIKNEQNNCAKVADIGTGSGAIILSLANNLKGEFFASDISKKALKIAKKNAKRLNHQVTFKKGDLLEPWLGQRFNLIVANLPYISQEDMSKLAFDLVHYEPRTALDGGVAGLDVYRRFLKQLPLFLADDAQVYCEIGHNQGEPLKKIATQYLPKAEIMVEKDYGGVDRFLTITDRSDYHKQ